MFLETILILNVSFDFLIVCLKASMMNSHNIVMKVLLQIESRLEPELS